MFHLRQWILAGGALFLMIGLVIPASAQLNCMATAPMIPNLRHEGMAELTGDYILTCYSAAGWMPTSIGAAIPQATITLTLSAPVTSRVLGGTAPQLLSEALLLVDDPAPANQDPCITPLDVSKCVVKGDGGQTFNKGGKFNIFEGIAGSASNVVTFPGVPIDPPASQTRSYRITNIRADATGVMAGTNGLSPVYAFVSVSPSSAMTITMPEVVVGFAVSGMTISYINTAPVLADCDGAAQALVGTVTFTENFATAFKVKNNGVQNVPGAAYYSESGLEISLGAFTAGQANTGTRLQTTISNIPKGVTISVDNWALSPASVCGSPGSCEILSDATLATGPGTPADPKKNTVTAVTNGSQSSVTVAWEVTNTNVIAIDTLSFNIYASFGANAVAPYITAAATSGFSSELASASMTGPIPEFSSTLNLAATANLFAVRSCQAPVSPAPGMVLSASQADFSWTAVNGASQYQFMLGTAPGSANIFSGTTSGTSQPVGFIPCNGEPIYAEIAAKVGGSFEPATSFTYSCKPEIGDFYGNGHQDLLWQNTSTGQVNVNYFGGSGPQAQASAMLNSGTTLAGWKLVGAADFDRNGVPDLVYQNLSTGQVNVNYYGGADGTSLIGYAVLNNGAGTAGWSVVAIADMNGDGAPDLIWQNTKTGQVNVNYYGGAGGASFTGWAVLDTGAGTEGWSVVAAADMNADGIPDLIWQNSNTRQVNVNYYGSGGGAKFEGWNCLNCGENFAGWSLKAVAPYGSSGEPGLVWQNDATRQVNVDYYGLGGAMFTGWRMLNSGAGTSGWRLAGAADFDGNGVPDLVWQNTVTGQVNVNYYGPSGGGALNGNAVLTGFAVLNSGAGTYGWSVVAVADMNGDGVPDLIWQNTATGQVNVNYYGGVRGATFTGYAVLNNGAGTSGWHVVGVADFDGNGVPDLVWQNYATRQVNVNYYGGIGGRSLIGWAVLSPGMAGWTAAGAADFDGNGVPDLVWHNDTTGAVKVSYYGGPKGAVEKGSNALAGATGLDWTPIVPR